MAETAAHEPNTVNVDPDDYTLDKLRKLAEETGVPRTGTKAEIAARINEQRVAQGAEGKDDTGTKGVDAGNAGDAPVAPANEGSPELASTPGNDDVPMRGDVGATGGEGGDTPEDATVADADADAVKAGTVPPNDGEVPRDTDSDTSDQGAQEGAVSPAAEGLPQYQPNDDVPLDQAGHADAKQAELDGKEASVPPSDPRESVTDHAPGKSQGDTEQRKREHEAGYWQDRFMDEKPRPQYYIAQEDDRDMIDVARKLGLPDHGALTSINGVYNGRHELQVGQRVLLPSDYDFTNLDHVETDEAEDDDSADDESQEG